MPHSDETVDLAYGLLCAEDFWHETEKPMQARLRKGVSVFSQSGNSNQSHSSISRGLEQMSLATHVFEWAFCLQNSHTHPTCLFVLRHTRNCPNLLKIDSFGQREKTSQTAMRMTVSHTLHKATHSDGAHFARLLSIASITSFAAFGMRVPGKAID